MNSLESVGPTITIMLWRYCLLFFAKTFCKVFVNVTGTRPEGNLDHQQELHRLRSTAIKNRSVDRKRDDQS